MQKNKREKKERKMFLFYVTQKINSRKASLPVEDGIETFLKKKMQEMFWTY